MLGALLFLVNTSRGHHLVLRYPPDRSTAFIPVSSQQDDNMVLEENKKDVDRISYSAPDLREQRQFGHAASYEERRSDRIGFHDRHEKHLSVEQQFEQQPSFDRSGKQMHDKLDRHRRPHFLDERSSSRFGIVWSLPNDHHLTSDDTSKVASHSLRMRRPTSASTTDDLRPSAVSREDKYLGLDVQVLGNALTPKAALCDAPFQLGIDHVTYIGHPVQVTVNSSPAIDLNPSTDVSAMTPLLDAHTISSPLTAVSEVTASFSSPIPLSATTPRISQNSNRHVLSMSMFHVVFALFDASSEQVNNVYQKIIVPLVTALKYEQDRCGYVRDEVDVVLSVRDEMTKQHASESVLDSLLTASSLVRDLVHMFEQLVEGLPVSIHLNQHVRIDLDLTEDEELPDIQPFHTLLLMDKPDIIANELKHLSSPLLLSIIHSVTIRRNLEVLQKRLCCTMTNLLYECKRLVQWKTARVIFPVHMDAEYTLCSPPPHGLHHLIEDLSHTFRTIPVPSIFQTLKQSTVKLSLLIPTKYRSDPSRSIFFDFIAELLRRSLIRSVQAYAFYVPSLSPSQSQEKEQQDITWKQPHHLLTTRGLQSTHLVYTVTDAEKSALVSLAKYMNGEYSVEEIAYRERISWRDIVALFSGHPDIILVYK